MTDLTSQLATFIETNMGFPSTSLAMGDVTVLDEAPGQGGFSTNALLVVQVAPGTTMNGGAVYEGQL